RSAAGERTSPTPSWPSCCAAPAQRSRQPRAARHHLHRGRPTNGHAHPVVADVTRTGVAARTDQRRDGGEVMVNLNQPDNDGVDEFFNEQVRVGIGVLSQVAMVAQRAREVAERQREAAERAETEQLRERMAAEREAAHAVMNNTRTPGWWEQATPQEVGRTCAVAHAWAEAGDPLAQLTRENMQNTIQARYGMSPEALQAMVREAELERDRDLSDAD